MDEKLLQACQEAVRQVAEQAVEVTLETELNAEAGIDSLAFMNIIIAWEECLGVELDDCLVELRKAKTVGEAVTLVLKITVK